MNDPLQLFRWLFTACFFATLLGGVLLFKNYRRLFGADPSMPSETASSRAYSATQVFLIWGLALKLFGLGAWLV
jgi:hypothetical protein